MDDKILECIVKAGEFSSDFFMLAYSRDGLNTVLYGENGLLDSFGLVSFLVSLESNLENNLNMNVDFYSNRAVAYSSPFKTIRSVIEFIEENKNV